MDEDMETCTRTGNGERKTKDHANFLNPFTVCSSCKRNFVVCQFVDEETNGIYLFANGLNGLAHLCLTPKGYMN
jgi:hypothetical protein